MVYTQSVHVTFTARNEYEFTQTLAWLTEQGMEVSLCPATKRSVRESIMATHVQASLYRAGLRETPFRLSTETCLVLMAIKSLLQETPVEELEFNVDDIGRLANTSPSTTKNILNRLFESGWIERLPTQRGRRRYHYRVTTTGVYWLTRIPLI
jgi:DNA-binding MarR family transcriptional regulator